MQNDTLATGLMSFIMHEIVYFGRSLPWAIIDVIPALNKYKIQKVGGKTRAPLSYKVTCTARSGYSRPANILLTSGV